MGFILVARNTHQDLDSISDLALGIWYLVWCVMIYDKLLKLKDELKDKPEERPRLRRVMSILMRRYDYGVDDMEEYRWGDFRDEIASVKRF